MTGPCVGGRQVCQVAGEGRADPRDEGARGLAAYAAEYGHADLVAWLLQQVRAGLTTGQNDLTTGQTSAGAARGAGGAAPAAGAGGLTTCRTA